MSTLIRTPANCRWIRAERIARASKNCPVKISGKPLNLWAHSPVVNGKSQKNARIHLGPKLANSPTAEIRYSWIAKVKTSVRITELLSREAMRSKPNQSLILSAGVIVVRFGRPCVSVAFLAAIIAIIGFSVSSVGPTNSFDELSCPTPDDWFFQRSNRR